MVNRGRRTPRRGRRRAPSGKTPDDDDEQQRLPIDLTLETGDAQQRLTIDLTAGDDNDAVDPIPPRSPVDSTAVDVDDNDEDLWDDYCFTRTLTSGDVNRADPRIRIDSYEAMTLTGNPELLELPASGNFSKTLSVLDYTLRAYNMMLSDYLREDWMGYSICDDWGLYVRTYQLRAGDQIFFYRRYNMDLLEPYYDIRFIRKPIQSIPMTGLTDVDINEIPLEAEYIRKLAPGEDWPPEEYSPPIVCWSPEENSPPGENWPTEEKSPDRKKKLGPGSRVLPDNSICLSKKLYEVEVDHVGDKPRLYLTVAEAGILIGCPNIQLQYPEGTLMENLVVFDTDNRQYDMLLSRFTSRNFGTGCTIDAGWQRFVHIHNLKDGADVLFYRLIDETINDEPYYVVRYIRNKLPGGSEVGPSGNGVDPSDSGTGPGGSGVDPSDSGVDPSGSGVDPSDSGVDPSDSGVDPNDSGVSPNVIEVGPCGSGVDPGDSGTGPGGSGVDPSGGGVDPSDRGVDPSDSGVSPNVIKVSPNGSGVDPGDSDVSPSVIEVGPNGSGVDPGGSGVSPSVIEVGPNGSGDDPSNSGVSPSAIGVGPSGSAVSEVGQGGSGNKES